MHTALLWCAVAFYGLGILLVLPSVRRRRPRLSPWSLGALGLGLLLHAAALAVGEGQVADDPGPGAVAKGFGAFLLAHGHSLTG